MKITGKEEEKDCNETSDKSTSKERNKKGRPQEEKKTGRKLIWVRNVAQRVVDRSG